jgi:cytochrome c oxidase assembly factor CtaG
MVQHSRTFTDTDKAAAAELHSNEWCTAAVVLLLETSSGWYWYQLVMVVLVLVLVLVLVVVLVVLVLCCPHCMLLSCCSRRHSCRLHWNAVLNPILRLST